MRFHTLLAPALVFFSACSSTPEAPIEPTGILITARESISRESPLLFPESFTETRSVRVRFATNRDQEGTQPGSTITYGETLITVPDSHAVGTIASSFVRGETKILALPEWKTSLGERPDWGVLVFVHGFNVDFNEALFRAAQIAYDLKFQGSVLLVSWPAGKTGGFFEKNLINRTYESNQRNAQASVDSFSIILQDLSGMPLPFQMMIHSMGHQVALPALLRVSQTTDRPFLQELVLNAPDYDPEDFAAGIPALKKMAKRITLYCSQKDNALLASKAFNGKKRLGACIRHEGIDVVNVSEVDDPGLTGLGHGYYSSRPLLTDLAQVFLGISAEQRLFIRKSAGGASENYFLRR